MEGIYRTTITHAEYWGERQDFQMSKAEMAIQGKFQGILRRPVTTERTSGPISI